MSNTTDIEQARFLEMARKIVAKTLDVSEAAVDIAFSDSRDFAATLLSQAVAESEASQASGWLPISEFKGPDENVVLFGTVVVVQTGNGPYEEWKQFLGYQDDDSWELLDPEYQEALPWNDIADYTHFMRLKPARELDASALRARGQKEVG